MQVYPSLALSLISRQDLVISGLLGFRAQVMYISARFLAKPLKIPGSHIQSEPAGRVGCPMEGTWRNLHSIYV